MPKTLSHKKPNGRSTEPATLGQIEELLTEQTSVILNAVDAKLVAQDTRLEKRFAAIERRIDKLEANFTRKLNDLTTTLDRFLKRMTDIEEEFTFMKADLNRVKAVLREKLGVSLD